MNYRTFNLKARHLQGIILGFLGILAIVLALSPLLTNQSVGTNFGSINAYAQAACTNATPADAVCNVPSTGNGCAAFGRTVSQDLPTQNIKTCNAKNAAPLNTTQTPAPSTNQSTGNTAGSQLPADFHFINIIRFNCLFVGQGGVDCTEETSLLDALIIFLYALALPLAILVIVWGGYRYLFGGITGKSEGLKTVQAAITGLVLVLASRLITSTVNSTFSSNDGLNADAIQALIESITAVLVNLSIAAAILVIIWGGYKYFFGALTDKSEGLKTIRAGVVGLVFILLASFIANTLNSVFEGISQADQASELPGRVESFILPIVLQITAVLQGLAALIAVLVIVWGGYQYFLSTLPNGKKNGLETISKGVIGLVVVILAGPIITLVDNTINVENDKLAVDPQGVIFVIQTVVTNFLIPVAVVITVFFIILGAYQIVTAGGESSKVKSGRDSLRNALVGLIVVLLATTFTQIIIFAFRNTELTPNGGGNSTPTTIQSGGTNTNQNNTTGGSTSGGTSSPARPTPSTN